MCSFWLQLYTNKYNEQFANIDKYTVLDGI